jgi:hypothetical protein
MFNVDKIMDTVGLDIPRELAIADIWLIYYSTIESFYMLPGAECSLIEAVVSVSLEFENENFIFQPRGLYNTEITTVDGVEIEALDETDIEDNDELFLIITGDFYEVRVYEKEFISIIDRLKVNREDEGEEDNE